MQYSTSPLIFTETKINMETRLCRKCNEKQPLVNFYSNGKGKKMYRCKSCDNKRKWESEKRKNGGRGDKYRSELRAWLNEIKSTLECVDCGISFKDRPWLCDFHHKDPATKIVSISQAITYRWKKEEILVEVAKCSPLCPNCHRIHHYEK